MARFGHKSSESTNPPFCSGLKTLLRSRKSPHKRAATDWEGQVCGSIVALTRIHCPGLSMSIVSSWSVDPYNSTQPTPAACAGPIPESLTTNSRLRYVNGCSSGGWRSLRWRETGTSTGVSPVFRTRNSASNGSRRMSLDVTLSSVTRNGLTAVVQSPTDASRFTTQGSGKTVWFPCWRNSQCCALLSIRQVNELNFLGSQQRGVKQKRHV